MKTISVLYGQKTLSVRIPEENFLQLIEPMEQKASDEIKVVREALQNPIASPGLKELTKKAKKVLIITNDHTRPMPSKLTLPLLLEEFARPLADYDISILIATGLHAPMTEAQIEERLGKEICRICRVQNHMAQNQEDLVNLGKLPAGYDLWVNRLVTESDLVIAEGFIEPHFFAGFSGGRKSILPGVSGASTIMQNHCPQNINHEKARIANLFGNPIHEECLAAAKMAKLQFILNVALNKEKKIIAAFAGDLQKAHETGCAFVKEQMQVPVTKADIVITSNNGYPLDRNVYQTVKGMETASLAVKPGGVIILAAECLDGVAHEKFANLIYACRDIRELYEKYSQGNPAIDQWQVQVMARVLIKHPIILVTQSMKKEEVERLHLRYACDLEEALQQAFALVGNTAKVSVMPEGPVVIPVNKEKVDERDPRF